MAPLHLLFEIVWNFSPDFIAPVVLRLWGTFGKAPAVRMRFLGGSVLTEGDTSYAMYTMGVVNHGRDLAENSWPQVAPLGNAYDEPQPLLWGENLKHLHGEGQTDFEPIDIPPGDETNKFIIMHHSSWDSQHGALLADMPIARRGVPYQRTMIGVTPDEPLLFSVTIVGDNFRCSGMRFRATLFDMGSETWRTLNVIRWYWHSPLTWRVHRWIAATWRWLRAVDR